MDRKIAPEYFQAEELKLITPEKIALNNWVDLYWIKDVKDDSIKLDIEWRAGSKYQDKPLVATFVNKMLMAGSEDLRAKDIAEEIDYYGGYVQTELDKDHGGVTLFGLAENMTSIFDVFEKAFNELSFPDNEFNKEVSIALDKFKVDSKKVKVLCRRKFNEALFGESSNYGKVATEEDFSKIHAADLRDFFKTYYQKAPVIFLTGNISDDFIERLRNWANRFNVRSNDSTVQEFVQEKGRVQVPYQDALQSAIRIGRLMFDKNHPDYFKFQLLNTVLGGYFGSRLMANIREDKGYTYGIGSGMSVLEDGGFFFVTTEVGADVKENAMNEVYNEFDRLRNQPIPADELMRVKNYMLGEFLRQTDGPISMMETFKNIYYNKLKPTYYNDFIEAIHDAAAAELQDLANKYLNKEEMLEVVAG